MTNKEMIQKQAKKFILTFADKQYLDMDGTLFEHIQSCYEYDNRPLNLAQYIVRLKKDYSESGWLLSEIAIPENDYFGKFFEVISTEINGDPTYIIKIKNKYFEVLEQSVIEYKYKKKTIYELEAIYD